MARRFVIAKTITFQISVIVNYYFPIFGAVICIGWGFIFLL